MGQRTVSPVSSAGDPRWVRTGFTHCLQLSLFSTASAIHASTSPAGCGIVDATACPPSCRSARSWGEAVLSCARKPSLRCLILLSTVAIKSSARIWGFTAAFATMSFHSFARPSRCPPSRRLACPTGNGGHVSLLQRRRVSNSVAATLFLHFRLGFAAARKRPATAKYATHVRSTLHDTSDPFHHLCLCCSTILNDHVGKILVRWIRPKILHCWLHARRQLVRLAVEQS